MKNSNFPYEKMTLDRLGFRKISKKGLISKETTERKNIFLFERK